jgi:dipeptidyl-peptidase-4
VAYGPDSSLSRVAFALAGALWVAEFAPAGETRQLETPPGVIDPRLSPDGRHVAYVSEGALHVQGVTRATDAATDGDTDTILAAPDGPDVTWGLAEFIAAEEMDRMRGYWWAPDSTAILVQRTDESHVQRWHIGDPADPGSEPQVLAYPAAGTTNAAVTLWLIGLDGVRMPVYLDDEYLTEVTWDRHALSITTLTRDQRDLRVWTVDTTTGSTRLAWAGSDAAWVDVQPGLPKHLSDGSTVWLVDSADARHLVIGDRMVTPPTLQVREVTSVDDDRLLFRASADPTEIGLYRYDHADGSIEQLSPVEPGVWTGWLRGGTLVMSSQTLAGEGTTVAVVTADGTRRTIANLAERPGLTPRITFVRTGPRDLATAVLFPTGHVPGSRRLPVLMDPYGGPGHQRVLAASGLYLGSQWFADQGYAVIVADGRGVPGRGPAFERAVYRDLATRALDDQVDALHGVAAAYSEDIDLTRVAIRGWSFGGYLAALAVLRRPDVFQVAVAGAPVTDWRLYDTGYTERFLGHPDTDPEAYERSSLLSDAPGLSRPLMLIHGLSDDNVVVAHTLRLSSALLAAGRPHTVLPLTGVTHMASQEAVAENLLLLQVEFLARAFGL